VHIAVDDCTRLAYAEVLPDQNRRTVIGFLRRAVTFYARHGITVEWVITDNGSAYRSTLHAIGKAERFIRTLLSGWAYGAIYRSSTERAAPAALIRSQ
jgi:transposase InsO family protein